MATKTKKLGLNGRLTSQAEKEDKGFFKKLAVGLIPFIGAGIMSAHFLIKNVVLQPKEDPGWSYTCAGGVCTIEEDEQETKNTAVRPKEPTSKVVIKKQPTFQDELKELSEYHQITPLIVNQIKDITASEYSKNTLEQMLSETTKYEEYFRQAASETGLDSALIKAYLTSESGHKNLSPHAKSNKGAIGPAQMLIRAAKESGLKIIRNENGQIVYDERRDPQKAIVGSAKYLKKYIDFYNDLVIGIASYNFGPGNTNKMMRDKRTDTFSVLFRNVPETRTYTLRVISRALIAKDPHKYEMNIKQKPSYHQQREAADEYTTKKEESIYKIFPNPTRRDLENIKYLNPAILNLEHIPPDVMIYLPERVYEPTRPRRI
ncbi:lytic transglycosylase domain-containing protein [Candidatus Woesearchaeota archaeon]|nr:lytic transglycosylase domain-containing protein [Candidatus Woesearchaeota archaeon]